MNLPESYLYGTAAYRPTNPPRNEFRQHLTCIKRELEFDILRLRVQWNPINRYEDQFDFAELDELADLCDELDLLIFLEISLQSAPYWLEEAHPDARYVNALGQAAELGPNESIQIGGYPGLCHHHPAVIDAGARFLANVATHFKDRRSVLCYDCWNEPHLEPAWISTWGNMGERLYCYCDGSRHAFRRWLADRYGAIDLLNDTWGRAFRDWNDVNPPNRLGNYADWLDWGRFWHDDLQQHMRWRYGALRDVDPDRFIISHSGAVPPFLPRANAFIHNWKLAEPVDVWGTSMAPMGFNWDLADIAGVLDATRSAAGGKPFWINEMSGGGGMLGHSAETGLAYAFRRTPPPTANDYKTWNWLGVCAGSKATVHWCYLEERTGPEAGGMGLVRAGGEVTSRARGAAETARVLRDHSSLFFDYLPQPQVGILFDPDNSDLLLAMEATDQLYGDAHIGINRAVWQSDNFAKFVTYTTLDDLAGLSVLIVPMCLILTDDVAKAVAKFVERGGVLVAEARTGHFDGRGFNQPILPAGGLTEVVGAIEKEAICSDPSNLPMSNNPNRLPWPDPIYSGPTIQFQEPCEVEMRTTEFLVPMNVTTGIPIAHVGDECVAVRNDYGAGRAYYIGTYLSLAIYRGDLGAMQWLVSLLDHHTTTVIRGNQLRPRLIVQEDEALLAVFNDDRTESHREDIQLPQPYRRAIDIYSEEEYPLNGKNCTVQVDPVSVRVLRLTI